MHYVLGGLVLLATLAYTTLKAILFAILVMVWTVILGMWAILLSIIGLLIYVGLRLTSRSDRRSSPIKARM